ncbi:MAG: hypothetical protein GY868_21400 [Deltaproteobacteria bacterium]|nr:hypothetical protein [Deltaproteobacteria bacterium]
MSTDHDDYDEKPSWREIDKKKDGSKHVSDEPAQTRPKSTRKEWAQKMYMKEIENLFKGKKASKEHHTALDTIHQHAGTKKFGTSVRKYIKEYGLPDDWSTLFLLLDYKDIKIVLQSIAKLTELAPEAPINLQEGLKSKLNIMIMTSPNDDVRDAAQDAFEEL